MSEDSDFEKKSMGKHGHCSTMSNTAWRDLDSNGDNLRLLDM